VNEKRVHPAILGVITLLFVWGLWGVVLRFTRGHDLANYGSYVPWGLWVSGYIYFVGLSAGAFYLSSLVYLFRIEKLRPIARPALLISVITLLVALILIQFDLGQMGRSWEVFTRPNFTSLMAWMVWLYTLYAILLFLELWLEMRTDLAVLAGEGGRLAGLYRVLSFGWKLPEGAEGVARDREESQRWLRILAGVGIPLAVAFHGGVGALFAGLTARPYWNTALYPIFFLTGALVSGGALLLAIVALTDIGGDKSSTDGTLRLLAKTTLGLLLFDLLLEWAEISIPAWYRVGEGYEILKVVLFGEFWYVFWIFHLLLGALIPIVLLIARPASRLAMGIAGGLIAATFMAVRLNLVIPGQVTPQLEGIQDAYVDPRLLFSYVPSMFEWSIIAFVVALAASLFLLGRSVLPLVELPPR
jgi:Ni/Fe-hydrogenase subunit HybB-like protein